MFNVPQVSLSCLQESFTCPCPEPEESNPHHPILSDPLLMLYQVSMYGICGGQHDIDKNFSLSTSVVFCHYYSTFFFFFFFFHWRYSPLWALAGRTIPLHLSLSITKSLHLLTPNTWRSLSTSSLHPFLVLPLRLVPSSSWVKIFLCILSSCILSRWPSQLILCPFIHFTTFSPLFNSSSSRFVQCSIIILSTASTDGVDW